MKSEAIEGLVHVECAKALRKLMPSAAKASICGVVAREYPLTPSRSARNASTMMISTLGWDDEISGFSDARQPASAAVQIAVKTTPHLMVGG